MRLCGTGWLPWEELVRRVDGWQAVWTDLDGAHVAAVPASAPDATHVWAWSDGCWMRARVDDGEGVAGFLHDEGDCPQGGERCREVPVSAVRRAATWSERHVNVGALRGREWEMIETLDGVSATFVRAAE